MLLLNNMVGAGDVDEDISSVPWATEGDIRSTAWGAWWTRWVFPCFCLQDLEEETAEEASKYGKLKKLVASMIVSWFDCKW